MTISFKKKCYDDGNIVKVYRMKTENGSEAELSIRFLDSAKLVNVFADASPDTEDLFDRIEAFSRLSYDRYEDELCLSCETKEEYQKAISVITEEFEKGEKS